MCNKWNEETFEEFIALRDNFRKAKRNKNYVQLIELCMAIIALHERAKFIGIMTPIFHKEIGNAYLKLNNYPNALHSLQLARKKYIEYRQNNNLKNPNDWLDDINALDKKILKIKSIV